MEFEMKFHMQRLKQHYLFSTHAYRTKRPVLKMFSTNMYTITPLMSDGIHYI